MTHTEQTIGVEVVAANALQLHDRIKRGSLYWEIKGITEFPKSRRLTLVRTGMPWETDVRRSTLVYRAVEAAMPE